MRSDVDDSIHYRRRGTHKVPCSIPPSQVAGVGVYRVQVGIMRSDVDDSAHY